jgi:response regulator of citrate/malate metabolism
MNSVFDYLLKPIYFQRFCKIYSVFLAYGYEKTQDNAPKFFSQNWRISIDLNINDILLQKLWNYLKSFIQKVFSSVTSNEQESLFLNSSWRSINLA